MLKSLKCQNIHCKRKIGEVMGTNYRIIIQCRRCKTRNMFESK